MELHLCEKRTFLDFAVDDILCELLELCELQIAVAGVCIICERKIDRCYPTGQLESRDSLESWDEILIVNLAVLCVHRVGGLAASSLFFRQLVILGLRGTKLDERRVTSESFC